MSSTADRRRRSSGYDGDGASVEIGRREVVGKVREGQAKLLVVLVWVELLWNGGSTAR